LDSNAEIFISGLSLLESNQFSPFTMAVEQDTRKRPKHMSTTILPKYVFEFTQYLLFGFKDFFDHVNKGSLNKSRKERLQGKI